MERAGWATQAAQEAWAQQAEQQQQQQEEEEEEEA